MKNSIILYRNIIIFGIPLLLLFFLVYLIKTTTFIGNETMSLAITADLLLTVPFIYFLLIRKSQIPKTTIIPVMLIGLLVGYYFLPKESQTYLDLFKNFVLPVIELSIISLVVFKVWKAIKKFRRIKSLTPDFYDTLKSVCSDILPPKVVMPFATEIAVFYYGFINWKKINIGSNEFTYHKKSGTMALLGALIMIIIIEAVALHFLLVKWSPVFAWILTGLSLYTAIQIFACAKSLSRRPIVVEKDILKLRYGIMNETRIPYSDIESITLSQKSLAKDKLTRFLSPLGELESHNVIITLKREHTLTGFYGFRKKFKVLGLFIDEPEEFKNKLEDILENSYYPTAVAE